MAEIVSVPEPVRNIPSSKHRKGGYLVWDSPPEDGEQLGFAGRCPEFPAVPQLKQKPQLSTLYA